MLKLIGRESPGSVSSVKISSLLAKSNSSSIKRNPPKLTILRTTNSQSSLRGHSHYSINQLQAVNL